jgi:predicted GH43/DUF377 family glycosyl hydrolase
MQLADYLSHVLAKLQIVTWRYVTIALRKYWWLRRGVRKKYRRFFALPESASLRENGALPAPLRRLPSVDAVVHVVQIEGVLAPYNASLIRRGDGYLLFFRYDTRVEHPIRPYFTHIGCALLGNRFEQIGEFVTIDTKSNFSEDPRALSLGDKIVLSYNDFLPDQYVQRSIRYAILDIETLQTQQVRNLHIHKQNIEKNWTPFSYGGSLYFEYFITPREVLKVAQLGEDGVEFFPQAWQRLPWPVKWGMPRGGTPACVIDDRYLAFFHSSFVAEGITWYVMAAYTFSAHPPFQLTAISAHPILFRGIYDSAILNTAPLNQYSVFPAGLVVEDDLIHISLGENDSAVKIVTLNREEIMSNLKGV